MATNRKLSILKKILIWTGGTFTVLLAVLVVHIYMVTRPKAVVYQETRQLSRIDFNDDIDSTDLVSIKTAMMSMDGMSVVKVNENGNFVVFEFDPSLNSSENIQNNLTKETNLSSSILKVSEEALANGCPIMDKESYSYKFSKFIENLF